MTDILSENPEYGKETRAKAIELASLVGCYFPIDKIKKMLESEFKEIYRLKKGIKELKEGIVDIVSLVLDDKQDLYSKEDIKELESLLEFKQEEYKKKRDEISLGLNIFNPEHIDFLLEGSEVLKMDDYFFSDDNLVKIINGIMELYSDPSVRELYNTELESRKPNYEILQEGKNGYIKIRELELEIDKLKKLILKIKIERYIRSGFITPIDNKIIKKHLASIKQKEEERLETLQLREPATLYRLNTLKRYRSELENTGFINFPSRQAIIDRIKSKILEGKSVLLNGPTGTGKTAYSHTN